MFVPRAVDKSHLTMIALKGHSIDAPPIPTRATPDVSPANRRGSPDSLGCTFGINGVKDIFIRDRRKRFYRLVLVQ